MLRQISTLLGIFSITVLAERTDFFCLWSFRTVRSCCCTKELYCLRWRKTMLHTILLFAVRKYCSKIAVRALHPLYATSLKRLQSFSFFNDLCNLNLSVFISSGQTDREIKQFGQFHELQAGADLLYLPADPHFACQTLYWIWYRRTGSNLNFI